MWFLKNGEKLHLSEVKDKLNIIKQSMWCKKLSYKPELRIYVQIKDTIETEPFLKRDISE